MPGSKELRAKLPALRNLHPQELRNRMTYSLQSVVPKVVFLTLPLLALLLALLDQGKGYLVEHLVFALRLQTFLFLAPLPARLMPTFSMALLWVLFTICLWMPLYIWRALDRVHPSPWWKSALKENAVMVAYGALGILCFYTTMLIVILGIE